MEDTGISMKVEQTRTKFTLTLDGLGKLSMDDKANVYEKIVRGVAIILSLEIPTASDIITDDEVRQSEHQNHSGIGTVDDANKGTKTENTGTRQESTGNLDSVIVESVDKTINTQDAGSNVKEVPVPSEKQEEKDIQNLTDIEPKLEFGKYQNLTASEVALQYGEEGKKYLKEKILPSLEKNKSKYPINEKKIQYINKAINGSDKNREGKLKFEEMAGHIQSMSLECGDVNMNAADEISKQISGMSYNELILSKDISDMEKVYDVFCAAVETCSLKF